MDLMIGDPANIPHPVSFMGKYIRFLEKVLRKIFKGKKALKFAGLFLNLISVFSVYFLFFYILKWAESFDLRLYLIINIIFLHTTLATKCLKDEALKIYDAIISRDLNDSRKKLSYIVGRDTTNLSFEEIIRATVETVAENTVDGIVAPLFYAFIGGLPLAMAYKCINTLDSMVGYKNEKYEDFGFFSAKIDDLFNFIPARITLLFMTIASMFLGFDYKNAFKIGIRDRKNHKSPNCAYPEGAVAGALNIRLGGTNIYFGKEVYKPTIGDVDENSDYILKKIEAKNIIDTNKIMYLTSFVSIMFFTIIYVLINH
ncbi:adenosylcobinamide-phosphate synthase CbiB [Peptostreptococcaceae bacterium AGR-M142]